MRQRQLEVAQVQEDLTGQNSDRVFVSCAFCDKDFALPAHAVRLCEQLSPAKTVYCRFCLRNDLSRKNNRHTLILTFRAVFGYFYQTNFRSKARTMCVAQIQDCIRSHVETGLTNPVFKYDPETYYWFIDFEKIGSHGRKIPINEVKKTISNILVCFNFGDTVPNLRIDRFYEKYREAVDQFYAQRLRPEGRRICAPTFQNCGLTEIKERPFDKTREFMPYDLVAY